MRLSSNEILMLCWLSKSCSFNQIASPATVLKLYQEPVLLLYTTSA